MKYCIKCGGKIEEDYLKFCPFCGEKLPDEQRSQMDGGSSNYTYGGGNYTSYQEPVIDGMHFHPQDVKNNKVMAILSYLGVLVVIPLLAGNKQSEYLKFHLNQGLNLWIIRMIIEILDGNWIYHLNHILNFSTALGTLFTLLNLAVFVLQIMGIVAACKGEWKKLPLVGEVQLIK